MVWIIKPCGNAHIIKPDPIEHTSSTAVIPYIDKIAIFFIEELLRAPKAFL